MSSASWKSPLVWGVLWGVAWIGARLLLETDIAGPAVRVAVALVPVPLFALFLWQFIAGIRSLDELERRIHLEALAVAFPVAVLLVMMLGLLDLAVPLNPDDWSYRHVGPYLFTLYFLGLFLARRRYQ
jgi:hypothetical protein